jgi:hypothetical protein
MVALHALLAFIVLVVSIIAGLLQIADWLNKKNGKLGEAVRARWQKTAD